MRRAWVGAFALLLAAAGSVEAQQGCRTYGSGRNRVTVCERDGHDRDRDRRERTRVRVRHDDGDAIRFGVRGGYDFDERVGLAGAQVRIPLVRQLQVVPSADVLFGEANAQWQINGDVIVKPDGLGGLYAGAGVAFASADFDPTDLDDDRDTEAGYNVVFGLDGGRLGSTIVRPFAEARWTRVDELSPFRLVFGINVPVSRSRW